MRSLIIYLNFLGFLFSGVSGFSQNDALDFDGNGDYITLSPISGWNPNIDFTVQSWFTSVPDGQACGINFRRLFGFAGPNRFEVGQCGGNLAIFWSDNSGTHGTFYPTTPGINIQDGAWHCISVVRKGIVIQIYVDGTQFYSSTIAGSINTSLFRVGHWGGGTSTIGQDWLGKVDEVRLWNVALPSAQLQACDKCALNGRENGLIAYWQLDDGIANMANLNTQVSDASFNATNPGILHPFTATPDPGFALNGTTSNFVPGAPLVYPRYNSLNIQISDPLLTIGLSAICDGDPVHFSMVDNNGNTPQPSSGVSVQWQYSDAPFVVWTPASPTLSGFTFLVAQNTATDINCPGAQGGYIDRLYRAIITTSTSNGTCMDTTPFAQLRICCKVTQVNVIVTPNAPLCEGDVVTFNVSLGTNVPPPANNSETHITWCLIEGSNSPMPLPFDDLPSFIYNYTVGVADVCFKAVVSNCCNSLTGQTCIPVDPKPVCGYIVACPNPNPLNLTLINVFPWPIYEICPGDDAMVCLNSNVLPQFSNCNPQWEYSFDPFSPPFTWVNLGFSNPVQNTNILPAHFTPAWPPGTTSIFYRVNCLPLSSPSGCDSCLSQNIIEIRLKPALIKPTIAIDNPKICDYGFATVSVTNVDPLVSLYTWYCNGEVIGWGDNINVNKDACYWVEATDGCSTVKSDTACLKVCIATGIITCPQDNPCAIPNLPSTLCAYDSFSNCGPIVSWWWTWDGGTNIMGQSTPCLTHIPALNGTNYTLTVTDACGCTHTTQGFIKPCQP